MTARATVGHRLPTPSGAPMTPTPTPSPAVPKFTPAQAAIRISSLTAASLTFWRAVDGTQTQITVMAVVCAILLVAIAFADIASDAKPKT